MNEQTQLGIDSITGDTLYIWVEDLWKNILKT